MSLDDSRLIPPKSYLDAIEVIASEGLKASRPSVRMMLLWLLSGVVLILLFIAIYLGIELRSAADELAGFKQHPAALPVLATPSVAVLLPELGSSSVGSNARRQLDGFELAFSEYGIGADDRRIEHFEFPFEGKDPGLVMDTIKELYHTGTRTFIMTMSGAVKPVKIKFTEWADTLDQRDRPVLVATVASAPGIAASKSGVFRHYIRSKDESSVLSTYVESLGDPEVFVVYIDEPYGITAMKIFDDRLGIDKDHRVAITLDDEESRIDEKITEKILQNSDHNGDSVAVIVGYGDMVKSALSSLWSEERQTWRFGGKILVTSTFTEEIWRPDIADSSSIVFRERILAVGPPPQDSEEKRGVVFQFSFLTLERALRCDQKRGVKEFTDCWVENEPAGTSSIASGWADVEFTTDGDSHVSLQLLDHTQW